MNEELAARLDLLLKGQQRLFSEVAALRQAFETSRRREPSPQADTAADMLRAIRANCGEYVFTCADLVEHATLPAAEDLRAAIVTAVGSLSPRRIGKALAALEGRDIGGLSVHRLGSGRDGVEWRVASLRV